MCMRIPNVDKSTGQVTFQPEELSDNEDVSRVVAACLSASSCFVPHYVLAKCSSCAL